MAYLDLSEYRVATKALGATRHTDAAIEYGFSPREWSVIGLARFDTYASLFEPGRVGRFFERLFGVRRPNALADPRLEALRRVAVLLRRGLDRLPSNEAATFIGSGFSQSQLTALAQHVAKAVRA